MSEATILLAAVALFVSTSTTIYMIVNVRLRSVRDQWIQRQSELYHEFWHDETHARVRWWLMGGFDEIGSILEKRNRSEHGRSLTYEENAELEKFDKFISVLARFQDYDQGYMDKAKTKIWERSFQLWIDKMSLRPQVPEYVAKCWPGLKLNDPGSGRD